jgi:hypothetical protein
MLCICAVMYDCFLVHYILLCLPAVECSSGCVNGECTDRDQCTCDDDWMGVSCNEVAIVEAAGTTISIVGRLHFIQVPTNVCTQVNRGMGAAPLQ